VWEVSGKHSQNAHSIAIDDDLKAKPEGLVEVLLHAIISRE